MLSLQPVSYIQVFKQLGRTLGALGVATALVRVVVEVVQVLEVTADAEVETGDTSTLEVDVITAEVETVEFTVELTTVEFAKDAVVLEMIALEMRGVVVAEAMLVDTGEVSTLESELDTTIGDDAVVSANVEAMTVLLMTGLDVLEAGTEVLEAEPQLKPML